MYKRQQKNRLLLKLVNIFQNLIYIESQLVPILIRLSLIHIFPVINIDRIIREIDKSESIELNVEDFSDYQKGSSRIHEIFEKSYEKMCIRDR